MNHVPMLDAPRNWLSAWYALTKQFLLQILGGLPVPKGSQQEAKDPRRVKPYQRIEILYSSARVSPAIAPCPDNRVRSIRMYRSLFARRGLHAGVKMSGTR